MARRSNPARSLAVRAERHARSRHTLARTPRSAGPAIDAYLVAADAWHEAGDPERAQRLVSIAARLGEAAEEVAALIHNRSRGRRKRATTDDEPMRVVFRTERWNDRDWTSAAFIDTFERGQVNLFTEHGDTDTAYFRWVNDSRPATIDEYLPLLRSMRRIGYVVELGTRLPRPGPRSPRGERY